MNRALSRQAAAHTKLTAALQVTGTTAGVLGSVRLARKTLGSSIAGRCASFSEYGLQCWSGRQRLPGAHESPTLTRSLGTFRRVNIEQIMAEEPGWMELDRYSVFPWSVAGIESCIVVRCNGMDIAFDMGRAVRESYKCAHVFISHGHIDHIAGLLHHAATRSLFSMKKACYYLPAHLIDPVRGMAAAMLRVHQTDDKHFTELQLIPVEPHETVQLSGGYFVKAFPTVHRVHSQGYILYHQERKLKEEYRGLPHDQISKLRKENVAIHDVIVSPEVAYTGDTTFEVFLKPPTADLLQVKILICESTYIDDDVHKDGSTSVEKARERGHIHLTELVKHEHLFKDVKNILLVHMSDKYSPAYIKKVQQGLPQTLRSKLQISTLLKQSIG